MSNIPKKIYVNVYRPFAGSIGNAYATRELADQCAARDRIACLEVTVGCVGAVDVLPSDREVI